METGRPSRISLPVLCPQGIDVTRQACVFLLCLSLWANQGASAQASAVDAGNAVTSTDEKNFLAACAKHTEKLRLFPGDTSDATELCGCGLQKIRGNPRVVNSLPKIGALSFKDSTSSVEHRYAATKLFSALIACKATQLDKLADSGALDREAEPPVRTVDRGLADPVAKPVPSKSVVAPSYRGSAAACKPTMPAAAVQAGATGVTRLEFLVDRTGHVSKFWIIRSSGETLAHKLLDLQAAATMSACPFNPATLDGVPIDQVVSQEFHWEIH